MQNYISFPTQGRYFRFFFLPKQGQILIGVAGNKRLRPSLAIDGQDGNGLQLEKFRNLIMISNCVASRPEQNLCDIWKFIFNKTFSEKLLAVGKP